MFAEQPLLPTVVLLFLLKHTTGSGNVTVVEKGPPGVQVWNTSQVCPELPLSPPQSIFYAITNTMATAPLQSTFNTYFVTPSNSPIVRLNSTGTLDRDRIAALCGNTILPVVYSISTLAVPSSTFCSITLRVVDVDDHTPTFPRSAVNFSIPGGSSSPVSWPMDLAVDVDEGINSTQNYYINTTNPAVSTAFYLSMTRDSTGRITLLQLVRNATLTHWQTPFFNFTLVAEEGRPNTPKGYQSIVINVQDVCDTPPVFLVTNYQVQVPENTSANSFVLAVKATDLVVGRNEPFVYSIVSQCTYVVLGGACTSGGIYPANGSTPFKLDSASGNLTLVQMVDYETVQGIVLTITATDSCNFVATTRVSVMVTYVNDKPPVIQFVPPMTTVAIREDYTLLSDVATVTITSPVTFTVVVFDNSTGLVSNTFYLLNIGSSYRLRLLHSLDSKVQSSYNVTIKAMDAGNNVAYSTITITVLAVNHPPSFDNSTAFVYIPYNTRNGTVVLHVHASDNDVGGSGVVTYQLPPPNATFPYQNNFTVNATSGDILVNGVLDRTVAKNFLLLVMARDNPTNGEPYLSDYMVANVTLLPANIILPIFPPQPSQVNIGENVLVGSVVFQVTAYANGTVITYGLVPSSTFRIDSVSGMISVVGSLNYSTTQQYVLNITAYNGFPPPSTFILTINVLPGDTVGPVFAPRVYYVQVMRTAAVGSHVVDINAVDTYSSAVLYKIVDGNGDGGFTINPTNGTITVQKQLVQASTQTYTLRVNASDGRYYSKWLAEVVINLQDLIFVNTPYYFHVQEGLPSGAVVGTIGVLLSYPGQVHFYIANGSDALSLNPTSGIITTTRPLAASDGTSVVLLIQAVYTPSSQGVIGATVCQSVIVFVTPRQSSYNMTILRSLDIGTSVLNVTTTTTTMGVVTYSLSSSSRIPFQVDANTGSIYTSAYLDSVPRYTYTFGVVVTSYGPTSNPTVRSYVTVTIQVDLSIMFDSALYNFNVSATSAIGTVVGVIRATGRRGIAVYYTFGNEGSPKAYTYLQINKTTGQISLLVHGGQLPPLLTTSVLAQDSVDPTISSVVSVSITSVGVTYNQPQITNVAIIVAIIAGFLLILLVVLVVALLTLQRRRKSYNPKVSDGDGGRTPNGHEMETCGSSHRAVVTAIKPAQPYQESGVPRETVELGRLETDVPPNGAPVYSTDSLSRPPKHMRSTSDLASTVGTEMLSGVEDTGPYTKAQLKAIYAANAQLLQEDGSQDSVHMFGSEGGVEADDQEVDIDRMLFAKAIGFEDEHCTSETTEGREQYDAAKDRQSVSSTGLDGRDEREQSRYHFAEKDSWLPAVTSVTDTIDELVGQDPRFSNDRLSYPLSQAMSLYSEGGSQSLLMRSQPHPHQYFGGGGGGGLYTPQSLHESSYFNEPDRHGRQGQVRAPRQRPAVAPSDHHYEGCPRPTSTAYQTPRTHRYSSITAIPHSQPHPLSMPNQPHSTGPQRRHSQDPPPCQPPRTPSSNTPTDDGLMESVPAHRVPAYYSSISSLASTNLSQPGPRDRAMY